jgi:hypothetical protein
LFVIDAEKCFGPPPPGETVLQNGDSTAKGVLYPDPDPDLETLRVFLTIVENRVIVGSLVTSL